MNGEDDDAHKNGNAGYRHTTVMSCILLLQFVYFLLCVETEVAVGRGGAHWSGRPPLLRWDPPVLDDFMLLSPHCVAVVPGQHRALWDRHW